MLILVAQLGVVLVPESSRTVISEPLVKLGSSLTAVTVTVKVIDLAFTPLLAVPPLSVTVTVITAVPFISDTGVYASDPVALSEVYVTVGFGIKLALLLVAVTVKDCVTSASPSHMPARLIV